ncbi:hypothetical protein Tco_0994867 [Tanacetum coccineum]
MSASNQQTLDESGATDRPPILKKGNYIPKESRFRRFLENKGEDEERMWYSIIKGPYVRPMITDLDDPNNQIHEPLSKMTKAKKKRTLLIRLMYGSKVNKHVTHSQLMNEFDQSEAKEGESLESVYERFSTLVNVMDHNDVRPIKVSINTKFLNSLKPEWRKYVTLTRQNKNLSDVEYDALYDDLLQFEPYVQASKAKRAAKNHDSLALIAHLNAYLSQSHATRAITQKFSTPTNNRLRTSSNTRNQAVIQDSRVDIQTKNAGYGGNGNKNAGRQSRNQVFNAGNGNHDS